jgi:hypothetical protein
LEITKSAYDPLGLTGGEYTRYSYYDGSSRFELFTRNGRVKIIAFSSSRSVFSYLNPGVFYVRRFDNG